MILTLVDQIRKQRKLGSSPGVLLAQLQCVAFGFGGMLAALALLCAIIPPARLLVLCGQYLKPAWCDPVHLTASIGMIAGFAVCRLSGGVKYPISGAASLMGGLLGMNLLYSSPPAQALIASRSGAGFEFALAMLPGMILGHLGTALASLLFSSPLALTAGGAGKR